MATPEERLDEAATMAENASAIAADWANGPVRDVTPEPLSGPLPTIKKFLDSKSAEIDNAANAAAVLEDKLANGTAYIGGQTAQSVADLRNDLKKLQPVSSVSYSGGKIQQIVKSDLTTSYQYEGSRISKIIRGSQTMAVNYGASGRISSITQEV